jgi:hypothetical protein
MTSLFDRSESANDDDTDHAHEAPYDSFGDDGLAEAEFLALAMALDAGEPEPMPLRLLTTMEATLDAIGKRDDRYGSTSIAAASDASASVAAERGAGKGQPRTTDRPPARNVAAQLRALPSPTTTQGASFAVRTADYPAPAAPRRGMRWFEFVGWAAAACVFGLVVYAWRSHATTAGQANAGEVAEHGAVLSTLPASGPVSNGSVAAPSTRTTTFERAAAGTRIRVTLLEHEAPASAVATEADAKLPASRWVTGWTAEVPVLAAGTRWVLWQRSPQLVWSRIATWESSLPAPLRLKAPVRRAMENTIWISEEENLTNDVPNEAKISELKAATNN